VQLLSELKKINCWKSRERHVSQWPITGDANNGTLYLYLYIIVICLCRWPLRRCWLWANLHRQCYSNLWLSVRLQRQWKSLHWYSDFCFAVYCVNSASFSFLVARYIRSSRRLCVHYLFHHYKPDLRWRANGDQPNCCRHLLHGCYNKQKKIIIDIKK